MAPHLPVPHNIQMLKVRTGAAAALIVLACAASACRKPADDKKPAEAAAQPATAPGADTSKPATPPPPPPKPVPEKLPTVIARVNGEDVTKADFDRLLKQLELQAGRPVPAERRDEIYRGIIDQLVTYTVLVQEAKARNISVTPAEAKQVTDARIGELRKQVPNETAFNKALAERNMTLARLRSDIEKDMVIGKMMEAEMAKQPPLSDADIKAYYDKNPDEFSGVRASHILIRPEGFDEASKKKARATAEDLAKQAKGGADFAELAKKHSADGSAQQGGDLGFFTKGQMVPEFSKAAFSLQPGQISDVVETQFGFHVIKVIERKDVQFAEAAEKLRGFLGQQRREQAQEAFIKSLKDKARIEVLI